MSWLDVGGKGQGHTFVQACGEKGINVDAGVLKLIF